MIVASILDLSGLNSLMIRKMTSEMPKDIKEYIERIKSSERKKQSLGAYTLLKYLHSTFFKNEMPKIKWSENGKPYFESGDINFSISHDGDFCAVMMTDDFADVGIDIQAIPSSTRVLDRLIRRILSKSITPYVREIIEKAPKATVLYHRLTENGIESTRQIECDISGRSGDFLLAWTITEATLKSVGHGLSRFKETEEIIKDAKVGFNIFMDKHGKKYVTCGVVKNVNENSPNKRLIM